MTWFGWVLISVWCANVVGVVGTVEDGAKRVITVVLQVALIAGVLIVGTGRGV